MASVVQNVGSSALDYPVSDTAFDVGMLLCLSLLIGGSYSDGWAHNNVAGLDTFFTPWHAVLYVGFLFSALYLIGGAVLGRMSGRPWSKALPQGYGYSLLGVAIFTLGGIGDMLWHIFFGVEVSVEATVSPTHLMLLLGVSLLYLGPLRAALSRQARGRSIATLPAILSLTYFWMMCTFFTQWASPFSYTASAASFAPSGKGLSSDALAIAALLLQTSFLTGTFLFVASRFRMPPWAFTVALTLQATGTSIMNEHELSTGPAPIIATAVAAGLLCDVLYQRLQPTPSCKKRWLTFGAAVPAIVFGLYYATVTALSGTWWSIHLLAGAPVLSCGLGYLLAWLSLSPSGEVA